MTESLPKTPAQEPLARKGKRPPRGQRIHRRKMLALQRRTDKDQSVTTRA